MIKTKKILFICLIASIILMPCAVADEKENPYSIKTLEKNFKYKNIEHQNFYPSTTPINIKKQTNKKNNEIPKIYNIDLNSSYEIQEQKGVVTLNDNLVKAKEYIIKGDFQSGLEFLNKISDKSPTWVLAEQAGLYEQINELHLALKTYEKAISRGDKRIELLYNLASCFYKSQNLNKAQELFEDITQISPDFMLAYYKLGNIHFKNNDYYKALRYYKKCLELNPLSLDSIYNMGVTLELVNEPKLALKYYQKYIHIDPKDNQVQKAVERLKKELTKTT